MRLWRRCSASVRTRGWPRHCSQTDQPWALTEALRQSCPGFLSQAADSICRSRRRTSGRRGASSGRFFLSRIGWRGAEKPFDQLGKRTDFAVGRSSRPAEVGKPVEKARTKAVRSPIGGLTIRREPRSTPPTRDRRLCSLRINTTVGSASTGFGLHNRGLSPRRFDGYYSRDVRSGGYGRNASSSQSHLHAGSDRDSASIG